MRRLIPKIKMRLVPKNPDKPRGEFLRKVFAKLKIFFNFFRTRKVKRVLTITVTSLAVILFLSEIVFAGLIYIGKKDNKVINFAERIIPFPMVLVNFHAVSVADYNFEYSYIEHFYTQSKKEMPTGLSNQITDQLITNQLLDANASKYNVKVTAKDIDNTINNLIEQSGGQQEVEKILNSYYGLDLKSFRKLVREQLVRVKMQDTVPVQIKASHILIKVDKAADAPTVAAAKAKADSIYVQVTAPGADFAAIAKQVSDDTGSRDQGGDLGWFGYGDMVKPFEDAAFKLETNKISLPVRTDYGWHIIKVTDRKGFVNMSFNDWLKSLRDQAYIKQLVSFK